jgi:DNA-binding transcriptional regulator YiaG
VTWRDLERLSTDQLAEIERALIALMPEYEALKAKLALYGVNPMDRLESHLTEVQASIAERGLLARQRVKPKVPTRQEVSALVKTTREVLDETQSEFGERMGVAPLTIHRWEKQQAGMRMTAWRLLLTIAAEAKPKRKD